MEPKLEAVKDARWHVMVKEGGRSVLLAAIASYVRRELVMEEDELVQVHELTELGKVLAQLEEDEGR